MRKLRMKNRVHVFIALLAACAAIVSLGCINALQSKFACSDKVYDGSYKKRGEIALLSQHEDQRAHVTAIDGVKVKAQFGVLFELLPGTHDVMLSYVKMQGNTIHRSKKDLSLRFTAQAGHTYEFDVTIIENQPENRWSPSIRDITNELATAEKAKLDSKIKRMLINARSKGNTAR